jgi:CDP-glucose 4,6-dehydratase
LDVVQTIVALSGRPDLDPVVLGDAPNEIPAQYLDSSKAQQALGWAPAFSLEEGLRRTIAWYRAFLAEQTP